MSKERTEPSIGAMPHTFGDTTQYADKIVAFRVGKGCYIANGEPISVGGRELLPAETYLDDGRIRISFHDSSLPIDRSNLNAPRLGVRYAVKGRVGLILTGLFVPPQDRQRGLGSAMLEWALDEDTYRVRQSVIGTGRINKPLVALMLTRNGFMPVSRKSIAEIVGMADIAPIPKIRWTHNERGAITTVQDSPAYGPFYQVVGPAVVMGHATPHDPTMVTALHTPFLSPSEHG